MKTLRLGQYCIKIYPVGARHWFEITWGDTLLKRSHERSSHRATMKSLTTLETFVNV